MITLKTARELEVMKVACKISAEALQRGGEAVRPGITTRELDKIIHDYILSQGAVPSFLGYGGFPGSACISVNEEVIHGIPGDRVIRPGDIVSIDVGAAKDGYTGDNAGTFAAGTASPEAVRLMEATKESLRRAIAAAQPGNRIGDISYAVQSYIEEQGFSVVRKFVGHGVGRELHEDPEVPNFGRAGRGVRLLPGMTLAIEPMVNAGDAQVKTLSNHWTVVTADGKLSAHFEHSIAITSNGPVVLTSL